ncbi:hypothetical protein LCGC14_0475640 [marine sediment metagenome]|uniref:Recombination endonuclease VII n=1 Tax=marine sediment metagenome TaxID=412755 RepID=A0A0F9UXX4_9ZZZZ
MKLATKEYNKIYYQKNKKNILKHHKHYKETKKEKIAFASYKYNIKIRYGMTIEDYNKIFIKQNGCCAICGRQQSKQKRRLSVDHNHKTGQIRGLLCQSCNAHLAWLENYNVDIEKHINCTTIGGRKECG